MCVGVRIYATQARGVGYSPLPALFPSTRGNPTYSVCGGGRPMRITPFRCTVAGAIRDGDVGRGTRPTVKRHTQLFPSATPPSRPVRLVEFLRRRALLVHYSQSRSAHPSTTSRSRQSIRTGAAAAATAPHTCAHTSYSTSLETARNLVSTTR